MSETVVIRTPDQRVRVFVSSTLNELAAERQAVRDAVASLRLVPVMFELGARPYPPRPVYRAYLAQSQVFVGIYWQSCGWVAAGEEISGLEDEYRLSAGLPRLQACRGEWCRPGDSRSVWGRTSGRWACQPGLVGEDDGLDPVP